jgi:hypothetical protein
MLVAIVALHGPYSSRPHTKPLVELNWNSCGCVFSMYMRRYFYIVILDYVLTTLASS